MDAITKWTYRQLQEGFPGDIVKFGKVDVKTFLPSLNMFSELLMKTVRQRQEKDIGLETCDRQLARVNALSCIYPVTHTKLKLQIPAHSLGHGGHDSHEVMGLRNEPAQRASFLVYVYLPWGSRTWPSTAGPSTRRRSGGRARKRRGGRAITTWWCNVSIAIVSLGAWCHYSVTNWCLVSF